MRSKIENPETTTVTVTTLNTPVDNSSLPEMDRTLWNALNFTTVAALTSASVVAVQTPMKTVLINLAANGSFVPSYSGGILGLVRALYAGAVPSLSGSAARAAYVTGTKNNKITEAQLGEGLTKDEPLKEENMRTKSIRVNVGYVASAAFGDIIVTQVPESLSQLKRVPGLITPAFKWYTANNLYQLMSAGIAVRYTSGIINFASMLQLEGQIASQLPIENTKLKHSVAGAASGVFAAIASYPFSAFKDYVLVQATVTADGKLINKGSFQAAKELTEMLFANPIAATKSLLSNAGRQLPFRVALTAAVFTTVAGLGEALGSEPLANIVPARFQPSVGSNTQSFFARSVNPAELSEQKLLAPTELNKPK